MTCDPFALIEAAAEFLHIDWRRQPGMLQGEFMGNPGEYHVTIAARNALIVRVVFGIQVPAELAVDVGALCVDTNWRVPDAGFFLSRAVGNRVVSAATIPLDELGDLPDPVVLRNTIRDTLLHAELLWLSVFSMLDGTSSLAEARELRPHFARRLAQGGSRGVPACLTPTYLPAPASDVALIDACSAAAQAQGWDVLRRAPDQLVVGSTTFLDVHNDVLIVSSYEHEPVRPDRRVAVSEVLNEIASDGASFSFALDLDTGAICTRTWLNLSGAAAVPPAEALRSLIQQSGGGSRAFAERIERTARTVTQPFASSGGSLRERLRRRAS